MYEGTAQKKTPQKQKSKKRSRITVTGSGYYFIECVSNTKTERPTTTTNQRLLLFMKRSKIDKTTSAVRGMRRVGSVSNVAAQRGLGMRSSRSAPSLDLSSLLRVARRVSSRPSQSFESLVDLCDEDELAEAEEELMDDDQCAAMEMMLSSLMQSSSSSSEGEGEEGERHNRGNGDDDDDEEDTHVLLLSLPFAGGRRGGARHVITESPAKSKHHRTHPKSAKKATSLEHSHCSKHANSVPLSPDCGSPPSSSSCTAAAASCVMLVPPPVPAKMGSLTVVLDLDETLVFARQGDVHLRPFVSEMLYACERNHCEVILWTAGVPSYVNTVLRVTDRLLRRRWYDYVVTRSHLWCGPQEAGCIKDLRLLHRDTRRVLVVENSPSSLQLQPCNVVLVEDFYGGLAHDEDDQSMLFVGQVIERTARNVGDGMEVAQSLAADPVLIDVPFTLAPEHSAGGVPTNVTYKGLRHTTVRAVHEGRKYSGLPPCSVAVSEDSALGA